MIVSRIDGGLGNQMFQYAFGLYVARKRDTELVLDLSSYVTGPQHGYVLDQFCISARVATPIEQQQFPARYRPTTRPRRWLPDWLNSASLRRVKEKPFGFQSKFLKAGDNSFLVGYWQSEQFFPGLRQELKKQFSLRAPLSAKSQQVVDRMHACPSVALHVRRGDYLSNPETAKIYEQLDRSYYQTCINQWTARKLGVQAFIFSNDLAWCHENLKLPVKTQFVDHSTKLLAHEDMLMMSHAACCIIANSTFSWWGAYLNDRSDKVIYVPKQWFKQRTLDDSDIACEGWLAVDSAPIQSLQRAA